jgi:hypothetical protein
LPVTADTSHRKYEFLERFFFLKEFNFAGNYFPYIVVNEAVEP